jgi:hypothetical protein
VIPEIGQLGASLDPAVLAFGSRRHDQGAMEPLETGSLQKLIANLSQREIKAMVERGGFDRAL